MLKINNKNLENFLVSVENIKELLIRVDGSKEEFWNWYSTPHIKSWCHANKENLIIINNDN